ncbi:hypothetical protein FKP32DRAFT_1568829 [Trametes sanguinea]|nr:hypothetical protein FKP32DRAFT_1568829 [Trametes sanguinea]
MAPRPWATDEQYSWLTKKLPGFIEAQQNNTVEQFLSTTYTEWFNEYELEEPTEAEVAEAGGSVEKAVSTNAKEQHKRLRNWFYNHARGAPSRRVLNLAKKKRGHLHAYQAYVKIFKDRVMPIINEAYATYRNSLDPDVEPEPEITFLAKKAKELYEQEDEDVRKKVEEYREWKRAGAKGLLDRLEDGRGRDHSESPERDDLKGLREEAIEELAEYVINYLAYRSSSLTYGRNIDRLPATLDHALKEMHELTGWVGYAIFAGPHPRTGVMTSVSCVGSLL